MDLYYFMLSQHIEPCFILFRTNCVLYYYVRTHTQKLSVQLSFFNEQLLFLVDPNPNHNPNQTLTLTLTDNPFRITIFLDNA